LSLTRKQGDQWITARTLFSMGHLARLQADYDRATALLQESLCMRQALEDRRGIALCLDALGTVAAGEGRLERASGLFGAAETLLETLGAAVFPQWQAAHEQGLAATQTGLAPATFEAAREAVRNMPVEEVVAYALTPEDGWQSLLSRSRRTAAADEARLTPREQEVAALLAHGLSNRQLAAELVITAGTAALHVKHILGKLGFTSRAQITAWAVRQDLIPASEHETARPSASGKH
jgi:DNA-binding CsgD family transcriptional regulator